MNKIIATAPAQWMPNCETIPYKMLFILSDGKGHSTSELTLLLGRDPRSARKCLVGPRHGYWLIHNDGKQEGMYRLDKRHFCMEKVQDENARIIAKERYTGKSETQCINESARLTKACREHALSLKDLYSRFEGHLEPEDLLAGQFIQLNLLDQLAPPDSIRGAMYD